MRKQSKKVGILLMVCIYIISSSFVLQAKEVVETEEIVKDVTSSAEEFQKQQILEEQKAKEKDWQEWGEEKAQQEQRYMEAQLNISEVAIAEVAATSNQITFFVPGVKYARLLTTVYRDGTNYRSAYFSTNTSIVGEGTYIKISDINWDQSSTFKLIFKAENRLLEYEIDETSLGKDITLEMPEDYISLDVDIENTTENFEVTDFKVEKLDIMGISYSYGYFSYEEGLQLPAGNYRVLLGGIDGDTAYLLHQDTSTGKVRFTKEQMGTVALVNKSVEPVAAVGVDSSYRLNGTYIYNSVRSNGKISKVYLNKGLTINSLSLDISNISDGNYDFSKYVTISQSNIVVDDYKEMSFDTYFKGEFEFDTLSSSEWKEMNLYQGMTIKDRYNNNLSYISTYYGSQVKFDIGKQQCNMEQNSGNAWIISVPEQTGNYQMSADFGQELPIHIESVTKQIKIKKFIEADDIGLFLPAEQFNQNYISFPNIYDVEYRASQDDNDYTYRNLYIRDNIAYRKVEKGWEISIANLDWSLADSFYMGVSFDNKMSYEILTPNNKGHIKDMGIGKTYQKLDVEILQSGQNVPIYMLAVYIIDENNKGWTLGTGFSGVYIPTGSRYALQIVGKNKEATYSFNRSYVSGKMTINEDQMESVTIDYKPQTMLIDNIAIFTYAGAQDYDIGSVYSIPSVTVENAIKIYTDKLSSVNIDIGCNIRNICWEFRYSLKDTIDLTNGPVRCAVGDNLKYEFTDNNFNDNTKEFVRGDMLSIYRLGRLLITDEYDNEIYNIYSQYNTGSYVAKISFLQNGKLYLVKELNNINEWFDMPKDIGTYTFKYELNPALSSDFAPITREIIVKEREVPKIQTQIAPYKVTVNGTLIDQKHSAYPMLAYEGITYFPMTWNFCQSLGVNTNFTAETGLSIDKVGTSVPVIQDLGGDNDLGAIYEAEVVNYPIKVNGKTINNSTQQYPIVTFRNMTYFPMTWQFANEAFGWNTQFDSVSGYSVDVATQTVVPTDVDVTIPQYSVRVNGERINNAYSDFPMLFYNNITYFPMTWDYCQALGLSKDFSEQVGFVLTQTGVTAPLVQTAGQANDLSQTYKANKVNYPITINGQTVENSSQDYPVLTFRDMIYFPMTWNYTYTSFGWATKFIEGKGFYISTTGDLEVKAESITFEAPTLMKQGEKVQLTAQIKPEDATNTEVVWKSSNESVLYVSAIGELVAKSLGDAVITATTADGSCKASQKITVQGEPVSITIPTFNVTLNGTLLHDQSNLYATINYEGITYVPLTWNYCQALGFNTSFDAEQGIFYVDTTIPVGDIVQDGSGDNILGGAYSADIPVYRIIINGEEIDNLAEEYPLLNFRNITYFPLTWSFAVERFGWDIRFDESTGFIVNTNLN